jgi:hypothetical protein
MIGHMSGWMWWGMGVMVVCSGRRPSHSGSGPSEGSRNAPAVALDRSLRSVSHGARSTPRSSNVSVRCLESDVAIDLGIRRPRARELIEQAVAQSPNT